MIFLLLVQLVSGLDPYPTISLAQLDTTRLTHACVVGSVVYVRRQQDGDIHVTLSDGKHQGVLEIIPQFPLPRPKRGTKIKACGVTRYDKWHKWGEIHPVTSWAVWK